jgi:hypothetical protein
VVIVSFPASGKATPSLVTVRTSLSSPPSSVAKSPGSPVPSPPGVEDVAAALAVDVGDPVAVELEVVVDAVDLVRVQVEPGEGRAREHPNLAHRDVVGGGRPVDEQVEPPGPVVLEVHVELDLVRGPGLVRRARRERPAAQVEGELLSWSGSPLTTIVSVLVTVAVPPHWPLKLPFSTTMSLPLRAIVPSVSDPNVTVTMVPTCGSSPRSRRASPGA